jgi:hypothetical protein
MNIEIPLYNKNKEFIANAIISKEDEELISKYSLYALIRDNTTYVRIFVGNKSISLHNFLMKNTDDNLVVDHIDNNGLNNTRDNLRITTKTVNSHNRKKKANTSSKYIGIHFSKTQKIWISSIRANGSKDILGKFDNELEAAKLYDIASLQIHKRNANNNNLLSKDEIEKFIKEDYIKLTPKERELPKHIYKYKNKFQVCVQLKNKKISIHKNTLEEANVTLIEILKIRNQEIKEEDERKMSLPIQRINNIPFIMFKKQCNFYLAFVDEDMWHIINNMKWHLSTDGYAQTTINNTSVKMHAFIYNYKFGKIGTLKNPIDHKNGNKTDNRLSNLHIISASHNAQNRKASKNSTSQYLGVHNRNDANSNKWRSAIKKDGIQYNLGSFKTENEAAEAYNKKALELYGENAFLNKIN